MQRGCKDHHRQASRDCESSRVAHLAAAATVAAPLGASAHRGREGGLHPALPHSHACMLQVATVLGFAGALSLGRVTTNVIAGGIAHTNAFARQPEFYAYGMMLALWWVGAGQIPPSCARTSPPPLLTHTCVCRVAGLWNLLASYWGMDIASAHATSEPCWALLTFLPACSACHVVA